MTSPSIGQAGSRRVLVACRPHDLSDVQFDAFITRHRRMVATIARDSSVTVLWLRTPSDRVATPLVPGVADYVEVDLPNVNYVSTRGTRLRSAVRGALNLESVVDRAVARAAVPAKPDAVVTIGPFLGPEYRALFRRFPTMHLFEEDLSSMEEIASQSSRGRAFRRVEDWLHARARARPQIVVSISPRELGAAMRRYPRAEHLYVPFTLSRDEWPALDTPSEGDYVVVAGNLTEARNAEGVAAVLAELDRRRDLAEIRIRLVSDAGLHESVQQFLDRSWVEHPRPAGALQDHYGGAWAALVPALRVTGQKTTILQAWACACPVVCSTAAAATVNAPEALVAGATAPEIVETLVALAHAPQLRRQLVRAGLDALATGFNPDSADDQISGAVAKLQRRGGRVSSARRT